MKFLTHPLGLAVLLSLCCTSCGDDPKLVEKREKQKADITRLKGELALIDEKLKNLPPDVSVEVADARKVAESQTSEVAKLEEEVAGLEAKKASLQSEFESYRVKYQAR